jgi:hypothetical protein
MPLGQLPAANGAAGPITVLNAGAHAYWSYNGKNFQWRSNSVFNGEMKRLYLPILTR